MFEDVEPEHIRSGQPGSNVFDLGWSCRRQDLHEEMTTAFKPLSSQSEAVFEQCLSFSNFP